MSDTELGKRFPLEHLMPLPHNWLEIAEAGHPMADSNGRQLKFVESMQSKDYYSFKIWSEWHGGGWADAVIYVNPNAADSTLRLAPMDYHKDRPLLYGAKVRGIHHRSPTDCINGPYKFDVAKVRSFMSEPFLYDWVD